MSRDLLLGLLYWRLVMLHGQVGQDEAAQLAGMLEAALCCSGPQRLAASRRGGDDLGSRLPRIVRRQSPG